MRKFFFLSLAKSFPFPGSCAKILHRIRRKQHVLVMLRGTNLAFDLKNKSKLRSDLGWVWLNRLSKTAGVAWLRCGGQLTIWLHSRNRSKAISYCSGQHRIKEVR
jgi:hypothetical protein